MQGRPRDIRDWASAQECLCDEGEVDPVVSINLVTGGKRCPCEEFSPFLTTFADSAMKKNSVRAFIVFPLRIACKAASLPSNQESSQAYSPIQRFDLDMAREIAAPLRLPAGISSSSLRSGSVTLPNIA